MLIQPQGFIDSATMNQVAECLHRGGDYIYHEDNARSWSRSAGERITLLLMREEGFTVAPGLSPVGSYLPGLHDILIAKLKSNGIIIDSLPKESVRKKAAAYSRKWIQKKQRQKSVKLSVEKLIKEEPNFGDWIDWVAENAWDSHTSRMGGLFDGDYIPEIASILSLSVAEVEKLHRRSQDPANLVFINKNRDEEYQILIRAYLISAKIRGEYHLKLANTSKIHLVPHPIRLNPGSEIKTVEQPLQFSTQECLLAGIILYSALKQPLFRRTETWIENIVKVRRYLKVDEGIREHLPYDKAMSEVLRISNNCGIPIVNRDFDKAAKLVWDFSLAYLLNISFSFFDPISGTLMSKLIEYEFDLYKKFTSSLVSNAEYFLNGKKLSAIQPGVIEFPFYGGME